MGIHFDWKVETESESSSIKEDAESVAARHKHGVRVQRTILAVAVILVLAGAAAFVRLNQAAHLRRTELEETVAAESLALRLSDQHQFLSYQMERGRLARPADANLRAAFKPSVIASNSPMIF